MKVMLESAATRYLRNASVEVAPLKEESVLFHPSSNKFCLLNRTMALIWSTLQSASSVDTLTEELCRNYSGVTPEQAEKDVRTALAQMLELDLLVKVDA